MASDFITVTLKVAFHFYRINQIDILNVFLQSKPHEFLLLKTQTTFENSV